LTSEDRERSLTSTTLKLTIFIFLVQFVSFGNHYFRTVIDEASDLKFGTQLGFAALFGPIITSHLEENRSVY